MTPRAVYLVAGKRTPFSKAGTDLAEVSAAELGKIAVQALLAEVELDPAQIDEVIMGCVLNPAEETNVARVLALRAGLPQSIPALTVSRNCASGFEAITQAADRIAAGRGDIFLAGGTESMSHYPSVCSPESARRTAAVAKAKGWAKWRGKMALTDADLTSKNSLFAALSDSVCGMGMGQTAELVARDWKVGREEQDQFALDSHRKAQAAAAYRQEEITPAYVGKDSVRPITNDNGIRENQTLEALAALKPAFDRAHGSVTAGNASQITDGAVALFVMSEAAVQRWKLQPLGRLVDYAYAGCEPSRMGLGPVYALHRLQKKTGLGLDAADLIEINEAFAAQVIGCCRAAASAEFGRKTLGHSGALGEIPLDRLNVNGGAIALGHPVGASGARIVLSTLQELRRRRRQRALVSLCVGGGQGGAILLESGS